MLNQPEFHDIDRIRSLMMLIEQKNDVMQLFHPNQQGITIKIGSENNLEAMENCSLITATYAIDQKSLGSIAVIGPTRMDYGRVVSLCIMYQKTCQTHFPICMMSRVIKGGAQPLHIIESLREVNTMSEENRHLSKQQRLKHKKKQFKQKLRK